MTSHAPRRIWIVLPFAFAACSHRNPGSGGQDLATGTHGVDAAASVDASTIPNTNCSGNGGGQTAAKTVDFLDSLGACTHIAQGIDPAAKAAAALSYSGLRGLRDDGNPAHVADWILVHQQSGARLSLLTNQDIASTVSMAEQLTAAGALLAVEGPNEPNNFRVTYQGQTSSNTTSMPIAKLQRDLYAAVKADPKLAGIPVFASSEAGGSEPDNVGLQFLTIPAGAGTLMPDGTVYGDYSNVHNYVTGTANAGIEDNSAWNAADPTLNSHWDGMYVEYGHTWRSPGYNGYSKAQLETLPRVTTETGWVTAGTGSITEEQQGKIYLSVYLAQFKRGFSHTFIYMLFDDPSQGAWGLFHSDHTAAKASGTYVHNLTTILADGGSMAAPGMLDYSIPGEPPTVHDLLLQKSNGTFELIVWDEKKSGTDSVTVNLGGTCASVNIYDPTIGTAPTQTLSNMSSVSLMLSDHPLIIEL